VTGVVLVLAADRVGSLLHAPFLAESIPLLLAGIALFVLGQVGQQALVARSRYAPLAKVNTLQAALGALLAIVVGLTRATPQGLFASRLLPNLLVAAAGFLAEPLRLDAATLRGARAMAREHRKLPLYDTLSVLSNTVAVHLPVFFFAYFFTPQDVGLYMMAGRLLDTPLSLVTGSLSRVYLQEGARRWERGAGELRALYLRLQRRLVLAGAIVAPLAWWLAPDLARLFLGEEWAPVGRFVQILLVWKLFEFLNVPTSTSLILIGRTEVALALRVLSLAVRVAAMLAFSHDAVAMLVALSVSAGAYYAAYNAVVYVLLTRAARSR
jgi:O-antigen/teichoic acid export membrane protein